MVHAPPARNIFPAQLSIFRPLSPDILPPMWEGKLFSYILSSPSRAGKRGDDGARPPAAAARYPGVPAWGCLPGVLGAGVLDPGCSVGASAAPCSADFDPPRRTAPAGRGPQGTPRPRGFSARGGGPADHRPGGPGKEGTGPWRRVLFPCSSVGGVRVFVGDLGEDRACIAGRGGSGPAPSRAQEGGREHPRRGSPPGPAPPPSCGARSETFVRRRLDQFFASSGASLPPPIPARSAQRGGGGGPGGRGGVRGKGAWSSTPRARAQFPAPPPRSRSLRKLRP